MYYNNPQSRPLAIFFTQRKWVDFAFGPTQHVRIHARAGNHAFFSPLRPILKIWCISRIIVYFNEQDGLSLEELTSVA